MVAYQPTIGAIFVTAKKLCERVRFVFLLHHRGAVRALARSAVDPLGLDACFVCSCACQRRVVVGTC